MSMEEGSICTRRMNWDVNGGRFPLYKKNELGFHKNRSTSAVISFQKLHEKYSQFGMY
jgi:hypothetical protein